MKQIEWVKLYTNFFEQSGFYAMAEEEKDETPKLVTLYFRLLCLAGKSNYGGAITYQDGSPIKISVIAGICGIEDKQLRLMLNKLKKYMFIDSVKPPITISWWSQTQYAAELEKIRMTWRKNAAACRKRKKEALKLASDMSYDNNKTSPNDISACTNTEQEQDTKKNTEQDTEQDTEQMQNTEKASSIFSFYTKVCTNMTQPKVLTEERKKALDRLLNEYGSDEVKNTFIKAGKSAYLCGNNESGWRADIDWLIRQKNFERIREGSFDTALNNSNLKKRYVSQISTKDLEESVENSWDILKAEMEQSDI